jgi:hypothetical protein
MSTASSLSFSASQAEQDREKFSHQTLILTALTAINSPNKHPTFQKHLVNQERIQYMKEKATHTPIIDAATAILITDTEILATMSRAHNIVALKELKGKNQDSEEQLLDYLEQEIKRLSPKASVKLLKSFDELLPDDPDIMVEDDLVTWTGENSGDVFISFPNINEAIPMQEEYTSGDLKPIAKGGILEQDFRVEKRLYL